MPKKHSFSKKSIFKALVSSGLHLWLLLILSNVFVLYSLHIVTFGQVQDANQLPGRNFPSITNTPTATLTPQDTPTSTPSITPTPVGPVMDLDFSLPGIGSGGGNLKPQRTTREVTVYLYAPDVNSFDNRIKPLFTLKTQAQFISNYLDNYYTAYVNHHIDFGANVPEGQYQIAFRTDQSLRKLIKKKEDDVGGEIFDVSKSLPISPGIQKVVMGDIDPLEGNNVMDIGDYNTIVSCYGDNWDLDACPNNKVADLNDDGKVDGIDYNIMLLGYQTLLNEGFPVPSLPPNPIPTVNKLSDTKPTTRPEKPIVRKPTVKPPIKTQSSSAGGVIIVIFILILLIGVAVFLQLKNHFFTNLLSKGQNPPPPPPPADTAVSPDAAAPAATDTTQTADTAVAPPADETAPPPAGDIPAPAAPDTTVVASETEIPVSSLPKAEPKPAETPAAAPPASAPAQPAPAAGQAAPAAQGAIDATYYIKKKSQDDKGIWVTLTGEEGALEGLYKGASVEDGFNKIKGTMKEENGKKYVVIAEILPAE